MDSTWLRNANSGTQGAAFMGSLFYGNNSYPIQIDDRSLAHLKVAILTLLRAGKSVAFSAPRPLAEGSGRDTVWISPSTDIRFHFDGNRPPRISEPWVRAIIATAGTPTGLQLVPEGCVALTAHEGSAQKQPG